MPSEAGNDAVGRAGVLDLGPAAFAGLIRVGETLRNDAVESGAFEMLEPPGGDRPVERSRRQVNRRPGLREEPLEQPAALAERNAAQVSVVEGEQIPGHE